MTEEQLQTLKNNIWDTGKLLGFIGECINDSFTFDKKDVGSDEVWFIEYKDTTYKLHIIRAIRGNGKEG